MMTTSIEIRKKNSLSKVAQNLVKLSNDRASMLQNTELLDKISDSDLDIANAATKTPIASYDQEKLLMQLMLFCKTLCRDLGIRTWDNEETMSVDVSRFYTYLLKYYKHLTMKEVHQAFEFLSVRKLDEYLPKDSKGQPDKGHFQMFSVEFQTKVLNAYCKLRNKVWANIYKEVPERVSITEADKIEFHKSLIDRIRKHFHEYIESGFMPVVYGSTIILSELEKQGIVAGTPKPTSENISRALLKIMTSDKYNNKEKADIKFDAENGNENEELQATAIYDAMTEAIKKVFDKIIEAKLDINNVVQYRI